MAKVTSLISVIGNNIRKEKVLEIGISAKNYCDINIISLTEWLTANIEGKGVDIFLECVGKNETVNQAIDSTAPAGKVVLVGNPYSDMGLEKNTYWKILRKQLCVLGTWNSSFIKDGNDDWHYVIHALAQGKIHTERIITHRFAFDYLMGGFEIRRGKIEEYGKVMEKF